MNYLAMLKLFLRLNAGPGDEEVAQEAEAETEVETETEVEVEAETEVEQEVETTTETETEVTEKSARPRASDVIREQKRLRQEAEARARRYEDEAAELRRASRQQQHSRDEVFEQEEARLKAIDLSTPEGRNEKWQIDSNRVLRANQREVQSARFEAADTRDRTAFAELARSEPKNYTKYAPLVEKELEKARAQGHNPPREILYNQLLAKDVRAALARRDSEPSKKKELSRGKLPGARSDTPGKGTGRTEHEKRTARLENVQI